MLLLLLLLFSLLLHRWSCLGGACPSGYARTPAGTCRACPAGTYNYYGNGTFPKGCTPCDASSGQAETEDGCKQCYDYRSNGCVVAVMYQHAIRRMLQWSVTCALSVGVPLASRAAWCMPCAAHERMQNHGVCQPAWRCCGRMHSTCNVALRP
jgi:hypothetical protein